MLFHTDRATSPWTIVNSNDKKRARLEAIRHVLHALDYEHRDTKVARKPDNKVVQPARDVLVVPEYM